MDYFGSKGVAGVVGVCEFKVFGVGFWAVEELGKPKFNFNTVWLQGLFDLFIGCQFYVSPWRLILLIWGLFLRLVGVFLHLLFLFLCLDW